MVWPSLKTAKAGCLFLTDFMQAIERRDVAVKQVENSTGEGKDSAVGLWIAVQVDDIISGLNQMLFLASRSSNGTTYYN